MASAAAATPAASTSSAVAAMADRPGTASWALLAAMREAGVRYLFANLGSDHTGIVEAYARARQDGSVGELPELVICPHEFVALSAAQGYTQVTGEAQAVLVHVDCGTQNLGGAVHNAARCRRLTGCARFTTEYRRIFSFRSGCGPPISRFSGASRRKKRSIGPFGLPSNAASH